MGLAIVSILFLASFTAAQIGQIPYIDEHSKRSFGTQDYLGGKPDGRIREYQNLAQITVTDNDSHVARMGLKDWGLLQMSVAMRQVPYFYYNEHEGPVCSAGQDGGFTKLLSQVELEMQETILDYELSSNSIFILTSDRTLTALTITDYHVKINEKSSSSDKLQNPILIPNGENIELAGNTSELLKKSWSLNNLESVAVKSFGKGFFQAGLGFHAPTNKLYVPTDAGLLVVDIANKVVSAVAGNEFVPGSSNITYCDVEDNYLMISYEHGDIVFYSIQDPASVKFVGKLDSKFFNSNSGDSSPLEIYDFVVRRNQIQMLNLASISESSIYPWKYNLFSSNYTLKEKNDRIYRPTVKERVMLVGTSKGLFLVNLESLYYAGRLPTKPYYRNIPIKDIYAVSRYHNYIYILTQSRSSNDGYFSKGASEVYQVVLFDQNGSLENWDDPNAKLDDLYEISQITSYQHKMSNIYADDKYVYVTGENVSYLYDRGVPKEYQHMGLKVARTLIDTNIFAVTKFILSGIDIVVAMAPHVVTAFDVAATDPVIICPEPKLNIKNIGDYVLEINATTRTCPQKEVRILSNKEYLHTPCLWSKTIRLTYLPKSAFQRAVAGNINLIMLLLLTIFLTCCVGCIWCYRRNRAIQKEYMMLKQQIGTLNKVDEKEFYHKGASGFETSSADKDNGDGPMGKVAPEPIATEGPIFSARQPSSSNNL